MPRLPILLKLPEGCLIGAGQMPMGKLRIQHLRNDRARDADHPGLNFVRQFLLLGGGPTQDEVLSIPMSEGVTLPLPLPHLIHDDAFQVGRRQRRRECFHS